MRNPLRMLYRPLFLRRALTKVRRRARLHLLDELRLLADFLEPIYAE